MKPVIRHIKDEILVVENVVPLEYQNKIINTSMSSNFPWYLMDKLGRDYVDPNITDDTIFYHVAHNGLPLTEFSDFFMEILNSFAETTGISIKTVGRIRLRYTHSSANHSAKKYSPPHVDFTDAGTYYTLIYYVDDSDGDTVVFDKIFDPKREKYEYVLTKELKEIARVSPKKGSCLFFNGHRYHSGNWPINNNSRIVVNFNFVAE